MVKRVLYLLLSCLLLSAPLGAFAEEIFLDAVVASIDDHPITLTDVSRHLKPPRKITLAEASSDPEFSRALDVVILSRLVEIEAQQRKITVFQEEINEYLKEIAKRNNMSEEEFVEALKRENHSLEDYREQVKNDILRSKLASSLSRGTAAVSDVEVEQAILEQKGSPTPRGNTVTLRQILISTQLHDDESALARIELIKERFEEGEKFDELASENSEGPERDDGGSLGSLAESDLNSEILDGIQSLDVGEVSDVIKTDQGYHLILLEERSEPEEDEESEAVSERTDEEREQIRNALKQRKLETKMAEFFTSELYKLHSVDKKI